MALKLNERYPGRFTNPSGDYPQGSFKNRSTPTAKDGSYLEKDWANDKEGFFQSLLSAAVIEANGAVDKVGSSQYYAALVSIINNAGTSWSKITDKPTTLSGYGVQVATQQESTDGTENTKPMTSLRVNQAITPRIDLKANINSPMFTGSPGTNSTPPPADNSSRLANTNFVYQEFTRLLVAASEAARGIMSIATAGEVAAGADDSKAITPAKLATKVSSALNTTLGYNRTYVDVTASRSSGSGYTNSVGAPIQVIVSLNTLSGADTTTIVVGGVTIYSGDLGTSGQQAPVTFIVPNGATYSVTCTGSTIQKWVELR